MISRAQYQTADWYYYRAITELSTKQMKKFILSSWSFQAATSGHCTLDPPPAITGNGLALPFFLFLLSNCGLFFLISPLLDLSRADEPIPVSAHNSYVQPLPIPAGLCGSCFSILTSFYKRDPKLDQARQRLTSLKWRGIFSLGSGSHSPSNAAQLLLHVFTFSSHAGQHSAWHPWQLARPPQQHSYSDTWFPACTRVSLPRKWKFAFRFKGSPLDYLLASQDASGLKLFPVAYHQTQAHPSHLSGIATRSGHSYSFSFSFKK